MSLDDLNPILRGEQPPPLLVILSGPSGVGKDSVLMRMRELGFPFHFVVTATSRPKRPGEIEGIDYHFLTVEAFERMIDQNELLEWANVYGHYKGIPKWEVREAFASGKDVILRIDVQGVQTVRQLVPNAVLIFIAPPNIEELRRRLMWRRTEDVGQIENRLSRVPDEMTEIRNFDYVVINNEDRLDEAVGQIRSIIRAERQRVKPRIVEL